MITRCARFYIHNIGLDALKKAITKIGDKFKLVDNYGSIVVIEHTFTSHREVAGQVRGLIDRPVTFIGECDDNQSSPS